MWLDIIVLVIIILSMTLGYRNGFIYSILHGAGWLLSIFVSFLLFPKVVWFLDEYTASGQIVRDRITQRFEENLGTFDLHSAGNIPKVILDYINEAVDKFSVTISQGVAEISMNIVIFVLLLFTCKLITLITIDLLSKKTKLGVLGKLDGILGLASGGLKGVIIVFALLALILPFSLLISDSFRLFMEDALYSSIFTKSLYDNNLLLLIVKSTLLI